MKKSKVISAIVKAEGISDAHKLSAIGHICGIRLVKGETVDDIIKGAFVWGSTPQGHGFWSRVYVAVGGIE